MHYVTEKMVLNIAVWKKRIYVADPRGWDKGFVNVVVVLVVGYLLSAIS